MVFTIHIFPQQDDLIIKGNDLIYSNPDETIKIAELLLSTRTEIKDIAAINMLLTQSYIVKGDYNNAIKFAFKEVNQLEEINIQSRIKNNILKATLLRILFLDKQSNKYLKKAKELYSNHEKENDKVFHEIQLEGIKFLLDRRKSNLALDRIEKLQTQLKDFYINNATERRALFLAKEQAHHHLSNHDSAVVYINKALNSKDNVSPNNIYDKYFINRDLGRLLMEEKRYNDSEESFLIALKFAQIINNPSLLQEINREIMLNYLASNQSNKHRVYNQEFLSLSNPVEEIEQKAVNSFYNALNEEQNRQFNFHKDVYGNNKKLFLVGALIVLAIGLFMVFKNQMKIKRLKEISKYLEISKEKYFTIKPVKKRTKKKGIVIPEETEQKILSKLNRFENSKKFLSKDMSLSILAGQLDINARYLSEVINKHYNDNYNTFINKLRINYIIDKLKNDPNYINYKISFLADECGFSSHSIFATVFKSIIGMSPVKFINLIIEDRKSRLDK